MTVRAANHYRASVHPLFSLLTYPAVHALQAGLGVGAPKAVCLFTAGVAALWMAALFTLLRLVGCRRFDAALFTLVAATSAAALFWFVVPETYALGSLSLLSALGVVALGSRRPVGAWVDVLVCAGTLAVTITNGMAGVLATLVRHPWRRAAAIVAAGMLTLLGLWGIEAVLFPGTVILAGYGEESAYAVFPAPAGWLAVLSSFAFHSMVMPAIVVIRSPEADTWPVLRTQPSHPGSAGPWGMAALLAWYGLLVLGFGAALGLRRQGPLRLLLGLLLGLQLGLHLVYGTETFLYALHFLPLLVTLTALATLTRLRPLALLLAAVLVVAAAVNNGKQLRLALRIVHDHTGGARIAAPSA